jgi:hypothetical protein
MGGSLWMDSLWTALDAIWASFGGFKLLDTNVTIVRSRQSQGQAQRLA